MTKRGENPIPSGSIPKPEGRYPTADPAQEAGPDYIRREYDPMPKTGDDDIPLETVNKALPPYKPDPEIVSYLDEEPPKADPRLMVEVEAAPSSLICAFAAGVICGGIAGWVGYVFATGKPW